MIAASAIAISMNRRRQEQRIAQERLNNLRQMRSNLRRIRIYDSNEGTFNDNIYDNNDNAVVFHIDYDLLFERRRQENEITPLDCLCIMCFPIGIVYYFLLIIFKLIGFFWEKYKTSKAKSAKKKFPFRKRNYSQDINFFSSECTICCCGFNKDKVVLLNCRHIFHFECFKKVYDNSIETKIDLKCPNCKCEASEYIEVKEVNSLQRERVSKVSGKKDEENMNSDTVTKESGQQQSEL